jgi:hypothetical protein
MTIAGLVVKARSSWDTWTAFAGPFVVVIWVSINGAMVLGALLPSRWIAAGEAHWSDGWTLLKVLRFTLWQLQIYLTGAVAARSPARFERRDFAGAAALLIESCL